MNREDIIKLALAAGIFHEYDSEGHWDGLTNEALIGKDWLNSKEHKLDRIVEILSPFAVLVAAAECEACAKVCDVLAVHPEYASDITKVAAQAIRARGNK